MRLERDRMGWVLVRRDRGSAPSESWTIRKAER